MDHVTQYVCVCFKQRGLYLIYNITEEFKKETSLIVICVSVCVKSNEIRICRGVSPDLDLQVWSIS